MVLSRFFPLLFVFLKNLGLVFGPQLGLQRLFFLLLSFHMKLHHFFSFEALQGSLGGFVSFFIEESSKSRGSIGPPEFWAVVLLYLVSKCSCCSFVETGRPVSIHQDELEELPQRPASPHWDFLLFFFWWQLRQFRLRWRLCKYGNDKMSMKYLG